MAVATSTLLGRPVWYELMTTDMKAAESFYKAVVGWTTEPFPGAGQPYTALNRSGKVGVGGIMNRPADMKAPPFWAMYVAVPKLEDAVAQITRRGGKTHTDVIAIQGVGRMQLMMDPQGAAFYIIEPASAEQRPEAAPEVGDASWHELMTTDADAALRFYEDVFHWRLDQTMDMGEMGKYLMFKRPNGHGTIGGIMNSGLLSPGDYDQMIARQYRPGQTQNVVFYHLVTKNTVETKLINERGKKRDLIDVLLAEIQWQEIF